MNIRTLIQRVMIGISIIAVSAAAQSAVIVPPQPGDQVNVTVNSNVSFDSSTQLYTYSYSLTSYSISLQEVWLYSIDVKDEVFNGQAPEGWSFDFYPDSMTVSWAAVWISPDTVVDGGIPPSPVQIKPGETLTGFSFQSTTPPEQATFYAQGYTPMPAATSEDDFIEAGYELKHYKDDSFIGQTEGPMSPEVYEGGRRPAVDGFLGFTNIDKDSIFNAPVTIGIKFSLAGELVDRSSFSVTLNNADVTAAFVPNEDFPGDLVATFDLDSNILQLGRNVLLTSVIGLVPGTTRTAADTDRITFTVE